VDQSKTKDDTLTTVANLEIDNINNSLNQIDRRNFCGIVDMIIGSDRIFTAGLGISYLLAEILSYQFYQIGIRSENFTHNYASFLEQALQLQKNDCLILFSFPPYSKETILTAEYARQKKHKVIAITNKNAAPINKYTDLHISVRSENMLFTNSFAAISVLINGLVTECAVKNKSAARRMLENLNKLVAKQNLVINQ
jgi:DNA-binding MurR/RpiR family transcriptional regulator